MAQLPKAPVILLALFLFAVCGLPEKAHAQPAAEAPAAAALQPGMFERIADPAAAAVLKLTDEQTAKIATLRTERAETLSKAAPADIPKTIQDFDEKVLALLTVEQRAQLAAAPVEVKAEPKLRFNFRFQRWSDVLEWFAEQADLSLVLDAPPPGTFNYSDDRQYSVAEAIDLLNGVLLTKGYTLIRRERMLIVVNIAEGIPDSLVPRVDLKDLDKRGKFEFVSVLFPVGKRDVEEIVKEIAPLLGPRGKSLPLPKTKQILVMDTAGVMRAIDAVIESIPQPEKPNPTAPEKPQLVVYPLKSADPDAAVKVLEALMPDGRFVRDPKANQISAYATPTQQAAVARVLEQMQTTDRPADQQSRFEVYALDEGDPKQSLATLQPLVPNARISVDPLSKKLAVWGAPADHEIIKKAVSQLGRGGESSDDRQVEVYRLIKADPTAAQALLVTLVPKARLAVDSSTRSIIALASLEDQKTIRATLDQLEPGTEGPNTPVLRFYPFEQTPPANLLTVLQSIAPKALPTLDTAAKRLSVVATPADHVAVKQAIEQFTQAASGEEKRQLVIYPVSAAQRKRFQLLLQDLATEFPTVKALTDAEPGELAIWAKPAEHKVIADMIEKLKQQVPADEAYQLVAYSLTTADPTSVMTVLQTMFPTTKIVVDAKTRRLVAWTRPAEQASIKSLIEQMDTDTPDESKNQLMVYPMAGADPSATITMLKSLAPDATLTSDTRAGTIVAWARKADHAVIGAAIDQMQPNSDPKRRPHVVAYQVGASDPSTLYPLISALVPTARVVPNAKNGTIAVWATPDDHQTIRGAIDEMTKNGALDSAAQVAVYPLKTAEPTSIIGMLQTLFPSSRMTYDAKNRRVLIFGRPAEQEQIKLTIEQMDRKSGGESNRQLAVYPIIGADPTATITTLKTMVPETTLTSDTRAGTIIAWGPKEELDQIGPALDRIQPKGDPSRLPRVVAYATGASDPSTIYPMISALVPTSRVVPNAKNGTIAVWATPDEHETIRGAIEEMTAKRTDGSAGKMVVYTLKATSASNILQALQTTVPDARLGVGLNSRKLVVWARPADHETIKTALEDLDQEEGEASGIELKSYAITTADPSTLLATLQSLFALHRETRLSLDAKTNKIVAMATPAQHQAIANVIAEIERGSPLDSAAQMEIHPLGNADGEVVMQVLTNVVAKKSSGVVLSVDSKSKQLIAVAPPQQQATIRSAIEKLQAAQRQFEVFQLEVLEPLTAQIAIEKLLSEGSGGSKTAGAPVVDTDLTAQRLYVRATKEQLEQIRELLVKMGETNLATVAEGGNRNLRVVLFSGDTKAAMAEIERVWPQLSNSPLRVLGPKDSLERLRTKLLDPKGLKDSKPAEPKAPVPPAENAKPEDASNKQTGLRRGTATIEVRTAAQEDNKPVAPANDDKAKPELDAQQAADAPRDPNEAAPIIVAPGDDRITIMSDDPEAIAKFEALLRALSPPTGSGGREIVVYPLHSASSSVVAELLQKMFRRSGFGDSSSVVVEADQRLNAIVVHAGRNDRLAIERLLKMLDSDEVPDSLAVNRPHLIPVENTSATRIELVLRDIYKTQLTSGGVKQQIPVPSGSSREVAAVIQQINTASAGPLMTLGVDDTTNSIVIMAPGPLVKEVTDLVAQLDENALHDTSRGVKIVKLKSTSALRVKEILDTVIKDAVRRKASSGGSRN